MMLKLQFGMTILFACLCSPSAIGVEAHSPPNPRTQSATADAQVPDEGITVPMKFSATMPAFEVKINNQGPFLFGLDTGASGRARADEELVEKLGLTKVDTTITTDGTGQGSRALEVFLFDKLELGDAVFTSVRAPSRSYNGGRAEPIGGMLGFQLFQEHLLTLDFPGEELRLTHGELPEADGRTILELDPNINAPTTEITIGGERVVCHIDTGNKVGDLVLPTSFAEKLPLKGELQVVGNAQTVTNQFEIKAAKLDGSVLIGEHEVREPYVMFVDILRTGNIGASMLKQFVVTFDQANDRVEFKKPSEQ